MSKISTLILLGVVLTGANSFANYTCTVAGGALSLEGSKFELDTSLDFCEKKVKLRSNFEAGCTHERNAKLLRCKFYWSHHTPSNETFTRIAAQAVLSDTRVMTLETSDGTDGYILRCDQN